MALVLPILLLVDVHFSRSTLVAKSALTMLEMSLVALTTRSFFGDFRERPGVEQKISHTCTVICTLIYIYIIYIYT